MLANCEHGQSDWTIAVGTGRNHFHGRACRACAERIARYWFNKPYVMDVVVLPTEQYEAIVRGKVAASA